MKLGMLAGVMSALLVVSQGAEACPSCKESVGDAPDAASQRVAEGYSVSILLMMAMPFALLGVGTILVVRAARRGAFPEL